jgi:hypothetical protein
MKATKQQLLSTLGVTTDTQALVVSTMFGFG